MKLTRKVLFQVLSRSFLLQASWNYEQMQSLGFLYVLAPALRRYYRDAALLAAYRRHLEYFNTHPYLASAVVGAVLKLEEQSQQGVEAGFTISEFKSAMVAPCAAMGDAFFWGSLRPVAAVIALLLAFHGSFWGPVLFVVLFNLPHIWFRVLGLIKGYGGGVRVVSSLQRWHLSDRAVYLKQGLMVLLGVFAAVLGVEAAGYLNAGGGLGFFAAPAVMALGMLMRRWVSPLLMVMTLALIVLSLFQFGLIKG